jgi:putative endonuclease
MPHFVYMLRCKGNLIYTGYAVDVQARYEEHCSGRGAKFTKAFPPECVLRTFELDSREEALRLEARIKKLKRPQKELLAAGDETLESELLAGLGETLKQRTSRIRKEKAKEKNRKLRTKGARACRYLG